MRFIALIPIVLLAACGDPSERAVEKALYTGADAYRSDDFGGATEAYAAAAFDPRVGYDLGNALYKRTMWDTAVTAYMRASDALPTGTLKAAAFHNLGNGWMQRSQLADSLSKRMSNEISNIRIEGDDIGMKVSLIVLRDSMQRAVIASEQMVDSALAQSASAYKSSLRLAPSDEDTRHNLALTQRWIAKRMKEAADRNGNDPDKDKDKELSDRAKQIMAKADELVEQYKFQEALKVMQDGLKADPTLKQKEEYMNKLNVVTKAAAAT